MYTQQMVREDLLLVGFVFVTMSVALVLHHWYKHRPGGSDPLEYPDRCFQESDVCNFHSCNHEMFVLAFTSVGILLILAACYQ
jgi:hypothetical protein